MSINKELQNRMGDTGKWGTLTGVKPLKLYDKLLNINNENEDVVEDILEKKYLVSKEKISLLRSIHDVQTDEIRRPGNDVVSIYIGIPFCPTRCLYCSFTSNQTDYSEIKRYLEALYIEMEYVSEQMHKTNKKAETIYVGGGTPTTLDFDELYDLISHINNNIPTKEGCEYTVEAGRPDTITREKLLLMKDKGIERISINPQTMKEETLELIRRSHTKNNVTEAFEMAKQIGFRAINTDLIVGLPGENLFDFISTLEEIDKLDPDNVTIHTLAVKKSSQLFRMLMENEENSIKIKGETAEKMLDFGEYTLNKKGYRPYYIYRQKYMADNLENVGYAKPGKGCIYNIRIMEEKQSVIAMGAGGSSKIYYPEEDRLERVINVSNYEHYINRIDEMIERKRMNIFKRSISC